MAYSQHEWTNGEIITAEKLNNMEQGIADGEAREISASAAATVDNSTGEPSVDVTAKGSVSSIAFSFAFKGIKGEAGEKGGAGERGEKGEDGVTPKLQKAGEAIQVSYDNESSWSDLVSLDDIKGEKGDAGEKGDKGDKGDTGEGFSIFKTYASVAEMEADAGNVEEGKFVLIASDTEDEDNAKLYAKGADSFTFLTDLSGAQGIKGEKGDTGAAAPSITACEISIAGSAITGKLSLSDGSSVDITGTCTAESGDGEQGAEEGGQADPEEKDPDEENPDEGNE